MPPVAHPSPSDVSKDRQKKPRHRHSPAQLAALNELFDQDEHPALELRVSLAERLGMETKTVNAWFQNKRASSKKRTVTRAVLDSDSLSMNSAAVGQNHEDYDDDPYSGMDYPPRSSLQHPALGWPQYNASSPEDSDGRPIRMRPTSEQADELKRFFQVVQHPSAEQRQTLADRIGMPYHSVTNWFQNQRSVAKRKKDDESLKHLESGFSDQSFANFPPPSHYHPSLGPPPPPPRHSRPSQPSISAHIKRSTSPVYPHQEENPLRRSNPRRSASATPYSTPSMSRPRRSRPEPHQLAALNYLYNRNSHPSVEERTALSQEVGMDLGKVTNWFRNMRQQYRRHAKKAGSGDEDEYHPGGSFNAASRSGSPSAQSSSSSMNEDETQGGGTGSDDDDDEAVTPRSESPAIAAKSTFPPTSLPRMSLKTLSLVAVEPTLAETETISFKSGIKIEDALLLLTFHRQEVLI